MEGRIHEVHKVFPLGGGDDALEIMIDGTSHYTFKDGKKGGGKWAARQKYVREKGALKVKEYAVHFVSQINYHVRSGLAHFDRFPSRRSRCRLEQTSIRSMCIL